MLLADDHSGAPRARKQAALIAALVGGTAMTALVGLAGHANGWRAVFALTAIAAVVMISLFWPNQPQSAQRLRPSTLPTLRRPQVRSISLVAVPEGAAVFGFVVFFAPALQRLGTSIIVAALATGAVGLGMLLGGIAVRRVSGRLSDGH